MLRIISGDGIGAEVTDAVKTIFKHENVPVEWDQVDVTGVVTGNVHSEDLYRQSVASLKRNKVGLKGRITFLFVFAELFQVPLATIREEVLFMMNKSPSARTNTQLVERLTS